jgi:hypothetical protein
MLFPMSTSTTEQAIQFPPLSATHLATAKVADRLVELMSTGNNLQAINELYADSARHVEVMEGPGCPRVLDGKPTIVQKAEQFHKTTTIHSASCGKPVVNDDQFLLPMSIDCTASEGPMAGQRMNITETALYTVKNGQITEAKFFYSFGC